MRTALLLLCLVLLAAGCRTRDYAGTRGATPPQTTKPVVATPPPAKPVTPPPVTSWYVPRSQWAASPILKDRATPMGQKPYRITVHHSADIRLPDGTKETGDPVKVLRWIEESHQKGIGKNEPFACIGYHFIIARDGRVFEGRPIQYQGAHATGDNNIGNIGVCLLGDFEHGPVPRVQAEKLVEVLDRLTAQYAIRPSERTVFGHKDFKDTDCPGRNLEPLVRAYAAGRVGAAKR